MKNLKLLIMPLVAISLLGCGNKTPEPQPDPVDPNKIDLYSKSIQYKKDKTTIVSTTAYTYNKQKLLEKSVEEASDVTNNKITKTIEEYQYDEHENVTYAKTETYSYETLAHATIEENIYTYDNKNRISTIDVTMTNELSQVVVRNKLEYSYEDKVTTINCYNVKTSTPRLTETLIYTYNDQNQLVNKQLHVHHQSNVAMSTETTYEYDEHNCATKIDEYILDTEYKRESLDRSTTATYYKNLYYRPSELTITEYIGEEAESPYKEIYTYDELDRVTSYENTNSDTFTNTKPYITYQYEE